MKQLEIRRIGRERSADIRIPNEPFSLFGRMVPLYDGEKWAYRVEKSEAVSEMCFPDENYDYERMAGNSVFIGAYDGDACVGLAILQQAMFGYMYLYDLKVSRAYRRMGAAKALLQKAGEIAAENGYRGIYTQGQDNNLGACLFYLSAGFVIGGRDTKVYEGTPQEGKKDIYFYLDL